LKLPGIERLSGELVQQTTAMAVAFLSKRLGPESSATMAKPVVIRREAEKEATEAVQWYAERSEETAKRFCDELLEIINAISAEPGRFPCYQPNYRYRLLNRTE
jgi:hypothetical protein